MTADQPGALDGDPAWGASDGPSPRRRRGVRVTTAAVVALGLAIAGGAVAGAASSATSSPSGNSSGQTRPAPPRGGKPPTAGGTVKSVGTDTFTLTTRDGSTVTVDVGSSTTYRDPSVSSPSFADVKAGEHVAVVGSESSSTVTATTVLIGNPPGGGRCASGGPAGMGGNQSNGPNSGSTTPNSGSTTQGGATN